MKILLMSAAIYIICYLIGVMLLPIKGSAAGVIKRFSAHIGYAYLLVSFYVFYVLFKTTSLAVGTALLIPFIVYLYRRLKARIGSTGLREVLNNSKTDRWAGRYLFAAAAVVYILAAWPYLATGFGNYWHNGNYDMEDGLKGRDAYLDQLIFGGQPFLLEKVVGDKTWTDFSYKTQTTSLKSRMNDSYWAWYAGDNFRLQYSNLAFWSFLLGESHGLDVVILHALVNLLLMATGIYFFAQVAFQLSEGWAAIAAFSSVTASFYLGTFWVGHIGSLMYGAMSPMLFCLLLLIKGRDQWKKNILWLLLVIAAMAFTYPQALALGLAYLVAYRIYSSKPIVDAFGYVKGKSRNRINRTVIFGLLMFAGFLLLTYGLWIFTEAYRIRQEGQYRAVGMVHDPGVLPVFWGFIPTPAGLAHPLAYAVLVAAGVISASIVFICVFKYRGPQTKFVKFFLIAWLVGLAVFYGFIRDSYYIYKYLYTHQFILIVSLCAFVSTYRYLIARLVGGGLLAINLVSDINVGSQVFKMPFNGRNDEYAKLVTLDKEVLNKTFVDLTSGEGIAVRQTFKKFSIETEIDPRFAKYFVVRKGTGGDITGEQLGDAIFSTEILEVRKSPEKNYLMVRTWFEPEVFFNDPVVRSMPFRWIGHGKNDNVGIYIIRPDHVTDQSQPYLRICGQKGPSAIGKITLGISNGDGKKLGELPLDGTNCGWLQSSMVKDTAQPLILRAGSTGKKLRLPEDRTLLYRIFAVAWVDKMYDDKSLEMLNAENDIVRKNGSESVIKIANGWWPPETFNGDHFRWASEGAEVIVPSSCVAGEATIAVDVEIGPSHGTNPMEFNVIDSEMKSINQSKMSKIRQRIEFTVSHPGLYSFTTNSQRKPIPEDYRLLDFRVFSIEANGC